MRRKKTARTGAALVESAIVVPFLFLLLMGMIEFGRMMSVQQNMTTAAREGAREATLPSATEDSVTDIVTGYVEKVPTANLAITCSPLPEDASAGDLITVSVQAPASSITTFGGKWFGGGMTLSATAAMRKEGFE